MVKVSPFRKTVLIRVGISSGVLITLFAITVFVGNDIERRLERIQKERGEAIAITNAIASYAELKKSFEENRGNFEFLENALPTKDDLASLPKEMRALGTELGVTVEFVFEGEEGGSAPSEINAVRFNLSIRGTYDRFLTFLEALRTHRYFITADTFDLGRTANQFTTTISGRVFSR